MEMRSTLGSGRINIFFIPHHHDAGPGRPGKCRHCDGTDRQHQRDETLAEGGGDAYRQKHAGNRAYYIHHAHDDGLGHSAEIPRDNTEHASDGYGNHDGADSYQQRIVGSVEDAAEDISAVLVRSEKVDRGRSLQGLLDVDFRDLRIIVDHKHGYDARDDDDRQDDQPEHGAFVLPVFLYKLRKESLLMTCFFHCLIHHPSPHFAYLALILGSM